MRKRGGLTKTKLDDPVKVMMDKAERLIGEARVEISTERVNTSDTNEFFILLLFDHVLHDSEQQLHHAYEIFQNWQYYKNVKGKRSM